MSRALATIAGRRTAAPPAGSHVFRPSTVDGAGFQQAIARSDPADGHTPGLVVYAADVAGFHLSTDGGDSFRKCNKGLTELWHRKLVAVEFDKHNPNCVLAYFANGTLTDATNAADVGRKSGLLYGVIDVATRSIDWTILVDGTVGAGPSYPATNLYPAAAEGANGTTARQTGNMIACDPFTADRWYVGTRQGVVTVTVTRTGGAPSGATVADLARNGAAEPRDMVTSVVIGPESTSTDTVIYFTVREGGANGGLNRRFACGPGQTGTTVLTRLAGTNSLTTAQGAEGCRAVLEAGTVVVYAWGGPRIRKWVRSSGATGTWTVLDPPGISASFRAHSGDAVRLAGDTATRLVVGHYSVDGSFPKIYWSNNGGSTWSAVTKAKTTLAIGGAGEDWWLVAAKPYYRLSDAAGEGGYDSSQIVITRDDPDVVHSAGRSGGWRTLDINAAGANWHPCVRGLSATVANYVGVFSGNPAQAVAGDVDWASILTADRYASQPTLNESLLGSPSYQIATRGTTMARAQGDRDANALGGVVYNANPFAGGAYVKLGGVGPNRCYGVALGRASASDATTTAVVTVQGTGIVRKVGMNTTVNATTVNATAVPTNMKAPVLWPDDGPNVYAYIPSSSAAAGGIWRSTNYGVTWSQVEAFTTAQRYSPQLIADPANGNRLYFVRDSGGSPGVYRVDNAATSFTVTHICDLAEPGPIAIDPTSGRLYMIGLPNDPAGTALYYWDDPVALTGFGQVADDFLDGALGFAHHMAAASDGTLYVASFDGGYLVGDPV